MGGAKKLFKKVVKAHMAVVDPGGYGEKGVKQVTGIAAQEEAAKLQKEQMKLQQAGLKKEEQQLAETERQRQKRMANARRGRRSLTYQGEEGGVTSTLGS